MTKARPKEIRKGKRVYKSEILKDIHESVSAMHRLGIVDKRTMRDFDIRCLTKTDDLLPAEIAEIREREGVSQAVFARALNITTNYVSQLERGTKRPRGATLKLLSLVKHKGLDAIL